MGMSANKVDEDIRNLEAFGEDALNSLNSIGAGYRELRKLRKLDDADRDLIINGEAVKAGDKDALVELIDEMAAKHVKEKDELTKQVADLQGTLNAREQVLENANKNKTQLEEEIEKLKGRKPDERLADLTKLLDAKKYEAVGCLRSLESILQQIAELPSGSKTLDLASGQVVALVRSTLDQIQHDYCLDTLDESGGRSWMDQAE
jgi:chromosome segregation ATPase